MLSPDAPVAMRRVTLARDGRAVLSEMSWSLEPGEFVGLLGGNGSGKTTLLRALLGLVPAGGELRVLGGSPRRGNPAIGYMPQQRAMPSHVRLCGRDFVAGAVRGHRWGLPLLGRAGRREVDRVLDLVDACALADRSLADLSGGQRQRLLLAQALVGAPRLLLLDEPLTSLDPHHQRRVVALVRRIGRETGATVLFSAHDLNPLLGALDRVLYLAGGRAALGAVDQVVTGPVLTRLYGTPVDVIRVRGRVFVMPAGQEAGQGTSPDPAVAVPGYVHV